MNKVIIFLFMTLVSQFSFGKKVLVISAMTSELTEVEKIISNLKDYKSSKLKTKCGNVKKHKVCSSLVGVGKVNAAMNTQKLITTIKPDILIFSGVAGGVSKRVEIGDIVIAKTTFQHDYGFLGGDSITTHKPGLMPELGNDKGLDDNYRYSLEGEYFNILQNTAKDISSKMFKVSTKKTKRSPKIFVGTVATGDQFIASKERKEELSKLGVDAVEMEGAASCYVALENKTPCLIIRAVSDSSSDNSILDYPSFFGVVAKNNIVILKEFFKGL